MGPSSGAQFRAQEEDSRESQSDSLGSRELVDWQIIARLQLDIVRIAYGYP